MERKPRDVAEKILELAREELRKEKKQSHEIIMRHVYNKIIISYDFKRYLK